MRVSVIAFVVIAVVLLLSDTSDAKKSHSHRKKRSDVEIPTMSNRKTENHGVKHHDKRKHKKQYSSNDIDQELLNSNQQYYEHTGVRRQKKNKGEEFVSNKKEDVKSEHKRKYDNTKCKKCRVQGDTIHDVDHIHSHDDSIPSSDSESTSATMKNRKHQKNIEKNYKSESDEESVDEHQKKKQKKYVKSMGEKKSKNQHDKTHKSKREDSSDSDVRKILPNTKEEPLTKNKVNPKSQTPKTVNTESTDNEQKEDDVAVPDRVTSKKVPVRSSNHVKVMGGKIGDNLQSADSETCRSDAPDDEQHLNKACEV